MATVRYIVDDVSDAVAFYVSKLGFEVEMQGPAFTILVHGDLTLWVAGPRASASSQCQMALYPVREAGPGSS